MLLNTTREISIWTLYLDPFYIQLQHHHTPVILKK